jgi:Ca2+-binding EF-hand superfamily protein
MFSKDRKIRYAGGLILASLLATTALAADAPAPANPAEPGCPPGHRGDIDLSKMDARAAKMFSSVDTNGDGKITQAEFLAAKPPQGPPGGPGSEAPGMHGQHGPAMGTQGPGMGMQGPGMGMGMGHHGAGPDGGITPQEREAFQADLYKALDTDHNGQLSQAEFSKAWDTAHTMMKTQMFKKFDKNGDGVLTKDEFPPYVAKMSAMDTNGDGTVSRDEMKAAHAAQGAQTPPTPPN